LVQSARRVVMTGVTVNGGHRNGIVVYQGGGLTLDAPSLTSPSIIQGATLAGLVAVYGSTAVVNNTKIQNNTQQGIVASDNSSLVLSNSIIGTIDAPSQTVAANGGAGVLVIRSSSARIGQNTLGAIGVKNVSIKYNGGSGISVSRGSYALIDYSTISNNAGDGINVEGASATLTFSEISSNGSKGVNVNGGGNARIGLTDGSTGGKNLIHDNTLEGIQSANGSAAYIYLNDVYNNGKGSIKRPGVAIYRSNGRLLGGNKIYSNGGHGVEVDQGSLFQGVGDFNLPVAKDEIYTNGYSGISAWNGASLDIEKVSVYGNTQYGVSVGFHSSMRIFDSAVSVNDSYYSGIWIYQGSAVILGIPVVTVTNYSGNSLACGDSESSFAGNITGLSLPWGCSNF
jgi:hypothetical protein